MLAFANRWTFMHVQTPGSSDAAKTATMSHKGFATKAFFFPPQNIIFIYSLTSAKHAQADASFQSSSHSTHAEAVSL